MVHCPKTNNGLKINLFVVPGNKKILPVCLILASLVTGPSGLIDFRYYLIQQAINLCQVSQKFSESAALKCSDKIIQLPPIIAGSTIKIKALLFHIQDVQGCIH